MPSFTLRKTSSLRAARSAKSIVKIPCSRLPERPPAQSAARLLQEPRPFLSVHCTPHSLPPLSTGAPLVRNVAPSLSSIDPGAAVGKQSPLVGLAARTERDGQKHLTP